MLKWVKVQLNRLSLWSNIQNVEKRSDGKTSNVLWTTALRRVDENDNSSSENVMPETLPCLNGRSIANGVSG